MKQKRKALTKWAFLLIVWLACSNSIFAQTALRREISPSKPMWIIHIDTWNAADPERIIELVPDDIRPYCVFSLSLSATDATCNDGYAVCDSWLKACAARGVWSMVQCASGSHSRFPDDDLTVYEDYFRKYPNFLGWNFAEQFWGFGDEGQPTFLQRLSLFGDILKICHRYGGYLVVSFTQAYYSADMMPIAYMKRNAEVRRLLTEHPEHFICCEKYTMSNGFFDIESNCLGAYLGGYAGQYGIRFDACGWSCYEDQGDGHELNPFVKAAGAIPIMEHVMLTGQTVIDGPETIPVEVSQETNTSTTSDGFTRRNWMFFPHFKNINIDQFRKILDGTVRIPTRSEVIDRTKICLKNNLSGGTFDDYLTPPTLFDGLYRRDEDRGGTVNENRWLDNKWWLKSTGRYPTIPQVYDLLDEEAKRLKVINVSQYDSHWPSISAKQKELNALFPQEYTGDIYAAHNENTWMTYNPYQYTEKTLDNGHRQRTISTQRARGIIPTLYNTAEKVEIDFSPYAMAVMKEYTDSISFYLSNYRNTKSFNTFTEEANATDTIRIYGATVKPTFTWHDRASHRASTVTEKWENEVFTLIVSHNGPLDLCVKCKGAATGRLTTYTAARIEEPAAPPVYTGAQQYEAECFDYKNISACRTNGYYHGHTGYQGQGFVEMGNNAAAELRDTFTIPRDGSYTLKIRYQAPSASTTMVAYINKSRIPVQMRKSGEVWSEVSKEIKLTKGQNVFRLKFSSSAQNVFIDCVKIIDTAARCYTFTNDEVTTTATTPAAQQTTLMSGEAGVIGTNAGNALHGYSDNGVIRLDMFSSLAENYCVQWRPVEGTAGVVLRGGYLFLTDGQKASIALVQQGANGAFSTKSILKEGTLNDAAFTADNITWRAACITDTLSLEASSDEGNTWTQVLTTTHKALTAGPIYWMWNNTATVQDIRINEPGLTLSHTNLPEITTQQGTTLMSVDSFNVSASQLVEPLTIKTDNENIVLSTSVQGPFVGCITLDAAVMNDATQATTIYVRAAEGAQIGTYESVITLTSKYASKRTVNAKVVVTPAIYTTSYDFEEDAAKTTASTPPATDVKVATGNTATAGVVSYSSSQSPMSNMLRIYGASSRNGTGILNLTRFTQKSTDYNVTWREVKTSTVSLKAGVLLRGNPHSPGTSSIGYTQGMMNGYYFCAYNNGSNTEFRIYKSTSSTTLQTLVNTGKPLSVAVGQSMWYRASVSGSSNVALTLEYSTDGETWHMGAKASDPAGSYTQGATQFVWGLAAATHAFMIDDIHFKGITYDSEATAVILTPQDNVQVTREEWYDLQGHRLSDPSQTKGIIIHKATMSNGEVHIRKVLYR